jgi:hypothetical protein
MTVPNEGLMGLLDPYYRAIRGVPQQQQMMDSVMSNFGTSATAPAAAGDTSRWENRARQMAMNRYGYSPEQFRMLDYIIERESGWDPTAVNSNGGAYGIPQILPSAHPDVNLQGDPMGQLRWLFNYIQQRYGGVEDAYSHKQETGWY